MQSSACVFQLGFADDLLLLSKADITSIGVFKMGLDRFAGWSGLKLNVQKSHLIISGSTQGLREDMLTLLGFQEGQLPMRYLGLPLLFSKLSDCQLLLIKIDQRVAGWEGLALSYAGRVQILKSVLTSLSVYWASAFILPKKIIKEIEKRLRALLWKGTGNSGYAKDPWHPLGSLIDRFPRAPNLLGLDLSTKLSSIICGGEWRWPTITDFECLEITHVLPPIHGEVDSIIWRVDGGQPSTKVLTRLFDPPGTKVDWVFLLWAPVRSLVTSSFYGWQFLANSQRRTNHGYLISVIVSCVMGRWRIILTFSSNADIVDGAFPRSANWFDSHGPTEIGQMTLIGQHENGGASTLSTLLIEHC
ncbi:UNVERIFIED_CONTAM: hypothetical protein Sindi_3027100 [Sesamum indicum]